MAWLAGEARGVLGFLAISLDRPADASEALRFVIDIPGANAYIGPFNRWERIVPDAIEALVTLGRLEDAARLLSRLEAKRGSPLKTDGPCRRHHDVAPCCSWPGETRKQRSPRRRKPQRVSRRRDSRSTGQSAARGRRVAPAHGKAPSRRGETRSREGDLCAARCGALAGSGRDRAQPGQAASAARLRIDRCRDARGCARRGRSHEPGSRRAAVHDRRHRRGPSHPYLPEARPAFTNRAGRGVADGTLLLPEG